MAATIAVTLTVSPPRKCGRRGAIARSGRPEHPDDLRRHACLRLRRSNGAVALWSLNDKGRPLEIAASGPLIANDFPTMLDAAVGGLGLAQVPEPFAAAPLAAGKLMHVLEPFAPTVPGVFLYYPGRRQMTPKLRAFIDHIKSHSDPGRKGRVQIDAKRTRPRQKR